MTNDPTRDSSSEASTERPAFLDSLGKDLEAGRGRLHDRRRRTNMVSGMAAILALVIGGTFIFSNLTDGDTTPGEVAVGDGDTEESAADSNETPPKDLPDKVGEGLNQFRCAVIAELPALAEVESSLSSDPAVAEIQILRAHNGLLSDEGTTQASIANDVLGELGPDDTERLDMRLALGFPVTDLELEAMASGAVHMIDRRNEVLDAEDGWARLKAVTDRYDTFVGQWTDGKKLGRPMTVAFVEGPDQIEVIQSELDAEFGESLFAAVQVDWTLPELEVVRTEIDALDIEGVQGSTVVPQFNRVGVDVAVFNPETIQRITFAVGDEGWCIEGVNPPNGVAGSLDGAATVPVIASGDGWRLLADEQTEGSFSTLVTTTEAQFEALRAQLEVGRTPTVDFANEIVIWFGNNDLCDVFRFGQLVADTNNGVVRAVIGTTEPVKCPPSPPIPDSSRTYVVAVERRALPPAPFTVQASVITSDDGTQVTQAMLDGTEEPPGLAPTIRSSDDELRLALIGMPEQAALDLLWSRGFNNSAASKNQQARVVMRDGQGQNLTTDAVPGRFNLTITNGLVTNIDVEERGQSSVQERVGVDLNADDDSQQELRETVIGMTELRALDLIQSRGLPVVVRVRDGILQLRPDDLVDGQLNLFVVGSVVTNVKIEGEDDLQLRSLLDVARQAWGLAEAEARQLIIGNGYPVRSINLDLPNASITTDRQTNRFTLSISDGVVVEVSADAENSTVVINENNAPDAGAEAETLETDADADADADPDADPDADADADDEAEIDDIAAIAQQAWGLSEADAVKLVADNGYRSRVSDLDSPPVTLPADRQVNRFTLSVSGNIVVAVAVEGKAPRFDIVINRSGERVAPTEVQRLQEEVIGMDEDAALSLLQAEGKLARVGSRDGVGQPITLDLRPGRFNLSVVDGVVSGVSIEGEVD